MTNIFSTYFQGENRVTSSIMAVIRSLSLDLIERILGALLEQSELEFVRFENQPSKGGDGVPDAVIQSSFRLLVDRLLDANDSRTGQRFMIFLLSAPDSDKTLDLGRNIPNDKKSKTGKATAFTMSQRYVSSEALVQAKTTSDLDETQ